MPAMAHVIYTHISYIYTHMHAVCLFFPQGLGFRSPESTYLIHTDARARAHTYRWRSVTHVDERVASVEPMKDEYAAHTPSELTIVMRNTPLAAASPKACRATST